MPLKRVRFREDDSALVEGTYREDCERIQRAFREVGEIDLTLMQAYRAWSTYSEDTYAAGWLIMDDLSDEDIYVRLRSMFVEID